MILDLNRSFNRKISKLAKNQYLHQWSKDKKNITFFSASQAAKSAKSIDMLLKSIHSGEILKAFREHPPLNNWLGYYKNHRRISKVLADSFFSNVSEDFKASELFQNIQDIIRWFNRLKKEKQKGALETFTDEDWQKGLEVFNNLIKPILIEINQPDDNSIPDEKHSKTLIRTGEMQYFMRIWIPCWFLYGDYATRILRRARLGDKNSICDLAQLDLSIIYDPKIRKEIYKKSMSTNQDRFKSFIKSLSMRPKRLKRKQIKELLAGFISLIPGAIQKLNAPDIEDLFNAISKDETNGNVPADSDIRTAEAFSKTVQRKRKKWEFMDPDKNCP